MTKRRRVATMPELAQLVLDTPGLVEKLALNCVAESSVMNTLTVEEGREMVAELQAITRHTLQRISQGR